MYPEAPIYTSIFGPGALPPAYRDWDIRPSFLNRLPLIRQHHQWFLPLYPYAFEHFDFSDYDLVLSVSSAFAHGIITSPKTLHICYCLTPARFLWDYHTYMAREGLGRLVRLVLPLFLYNLRLWDRLAADRVDHFLAISQTVQQRIRKLYRRDAKVMYPPIDAQRFPLSQEPGDYFLILSRLVPYKRIDLAVRAFSQLGLPLLVIGDGRDRQALEGIAAPNVRFLGREGTTGVFFRARTPESLAEAVKRFDSLHFDPAGIREHAVAFDRAVFQRKLADFIRVVYGEFSARHTLAQGD